MFTRLRRQRRTEPPGPADFVDLAHRSVFGHPADGASRQRFDAGADINRVGVLSAMLRDPRHAERMVAGLIPAHEGASDEQFLRAAYRALLDRDADPVGLATFSQRLRAGKSRADVVRSLVGSEEYLAPALRRYFPLTDLRPLRPDRYVEVRDVTGHPTVAFQAHGPDDFDWLEAAIVDGGYYDKPGVWSLAVDTDKRLMAEIVSVFSPTRVLELGCASGAVLGCLLDLGVDGEGVEISQAAIDAAAPAVRPRIHRLDATAFDLGAAYDVVFGLDIFEHLNPNRLGACLERVAAHLRPGGYVFANIPAFGADPVFGEVFQVYLEPWLADVAAGRLFHTLHVDDLGYPINGHLAWAHTDWWTGRFAAVGLRRERGIEAALHARYDAYLTAATPARRSFYVFSRDAEAGAAERIAAAVSGSGSTVLAGLSIG